MSLKDIQRRLKVTPDDVWGPITEKAINAVLDKAGIDRVAPAASMSYEDFIGGYIDAHEGGLSLDPRDNGNWYDHTRYLHNLPQRRNMGNLVGSKFGVTAYALAKYRGTSVITAADIANLTRAEAVAIGIDLYVKRPGLDMLPWNRVTASIIDKGWGSGPVTAIKLLQRMLGVADDGKLGAVTLDSYKGFLNVHGEDGAAHLWADERTKFDTMLASNEGASDPDRVYLNGWNNRTRSFLPGTPWWNAWG